MASDCKYISSLNCFANLNSENMCYVQDDSNQTLNSTDCANFKRAIWHLSFKVFLDSVSGYSKTGCWVMCGDGIDHLLFPIILILAADFEEL